MAHFLENGQDFWEVMGNKAYPQDPGELRNPRQVEDTLAAAEGSAARINACILADISVYEEDAKYYKKLATAQAHEAAILATETRTSIYALQEDVYRYREAAMTYRERLCEQEKRFIEQQRLTGVACTALAMVHEEIKRLKDSSSL
jgi:hypothetical protein